MTAANKAGVGVRGGGLVMRQHLELQHRWVPHQRLRTVVAANLIKQEYLSTLMHPHQHGYEHDGGMLYPTSFAQGWHSPFAYRTSFSVSSFLVSPSS
ncbi:hypothetical protein BDQ12DRAFT_737243 [Crucibulum laeve]|uniref:Uncharacterized protein n=1 Tax=Crucibulum laeve TaxID=68775 RepID=A0A5C3M4C1_9AGAR|nr:hypothetical protein BDQ12DRAFT_737243 [Crucibulum laeve]